FGPEEHRDLCATAPGFGDHLLALSSAGAGLRSTRRAALRVHPVVGIFRLPPLHYAARPLPTLPGGPRRRSSLERWQTHSHQSLSALPSPLGASPFLERNGPGVSHFLGKGF